MSRAWHLPKSLRSPTKMLLACDEINGVERLDSCYAKPMCVSISWFGLNISRNDDVALGCTWPSLSAANTCRGPWQCDLILTSCVWTSLRQKQLFMTLIWTSLESELYKFYEWQRNEVNKMNMFHFEPIPASITVPLHELELVTVSFILSSLGGKYSKYQLSTLTCFWLKNCRVRWGFVPFHAYFTALWMLFWELQVWVAGK